MSMKIAVATVLLLASNIALATESYQLRASLGVWKTWGSSLQYYDLQITESAATQNQLIIRHCTIDIEFSGTCTPYDNFVGAGVYSAKSDSIQVTETVGSPTPSYELQIDGNDARKLLRTWGAEKIRYFRISGPNP